MADKEKKPEKLISQLDIIYFILALFAVIFIRDLWLAQSHMKTIPYSEFRTALEKGEIKDAQVGQTRIVGTFVKPGENGQPQHFSTIRVDPQIADELGCRLSRATMRNIRQNLFFALVYNAAGVPVAAGVLYPFLGILISPMFAAFAL